MPLPTIVRALLPCLSLVAGACTDPSPIAGEAFAGDGEPVAAWVTTADQRLRLAPGAPVRFRPATARPADIEVDPDEQFQAMVGFGAAVTDASAILIRRLDEGARTALMRDLFGPAPGVGISFVRLPVGASDFSTSHYSFDDMPEGQIDPDLAHFSIAPIRDTIIPTVLEAQALNPALKVMASPWSAPGWMKSTGSLVRGTLLPRYYAAFSAYLGRYVDAMQAAGIPLYALTLQNEPHFEPKNYPGMRLDAAARAELIGRHVGPALAQQSHAPLLFDWDHNWDHPEEPSQVLADPLAARYTAAVAWHCYGGHVAAQTPVHAAHPDKDAYLTECSGGGWEHESPLLHMTRELIIGSTRGFSRGVLLWNLALDESSGPHLGGCNNCRGLVTINSRTGEVTRNDDYYVIAHASRFVHEGARRVASTEGHGGVDNVAFLNPHGAMVMILANDNTAARTVTVRSRGREFRYTLPARSVVTLTWPAQAPLR